MMVEMLSWGCSLLFFNRFLRFSTVRKHLNEGCADGLEMLVESTMACNRVKDGSVARLVLDAVVVKLVNDQELIGSNV